MRIKAERSLFAVTPNEKSAGGNKPAITKTCPQAKKERGSKDPQRGRLDMKNGRHGEGQLAKYEPKRTSGPRTKTGR